MKTIFDITAIYLMAMHVFFLTKFSFSEKLNFKITLILYLQAKNFMNQPTLICMYVKLQVLTVIDHPIYGC